ncbi:hypothetical protein H8S66_15010 [Pseudomonas lurida]|uniref:hypothetical protein n=1 Tax=Pseudomonas lurida TaxID=244566 RepID=UPI0016546D88|nr:hypothetical protein [Pseudomonas lurida]MBC3924183.1 hypothetical protein [Pseudomonas lurida]
MVDDHIFGYLQPTYGVLVGIFEDRANVLKLRNGMFFVDLVQSGCDQAADALKVVQSDDHGYEILKKIYDDFFILRELIN